MPVNFQFGSSTSHVPSPLAFRVTLLFLILAFLGSHASYSQAQPDEQPPAKEINPAEPGSAPDTGEGAADGSPPSPKDMKDGDEADTDKPESDAGEKTSEDNETEHITNLVILVQGNEGALEPIRGADVFVSVKDHDDVQTATNAKGLANISIPSGRIKIQVTARDWKTFGDFFVVKEEQEEIRITLESRNPGAP